KLPAGHLHDSYPVSARHGRLRPLSNDTTASGFDVPRYLDRVSCDSTRMPGQWGCPGVPGQLGYSPKGALNRSGDGDTLKV
ncbi:MAG: hypothetical protein V3T35_03610, partial [Spirochaetia bacterium]